MIKRASSIQGVSLLNCESWIRDDILESMGDDEIELEEIEAVLKRIQRFDPVGVAAKDLRDCLLIQLSQFSNC